MTPRILGDVFVVTRATPARGPLVTMTVLMLAVFTVSVGYGVVLPLLPDLLGLGGGTADIARSTGLLTALYMIALFVFAPAWDGGPIATDAVSFF